jgi:hypothetical protein
MPVARRTRSLACEYEKHTSLSHHRYTGVNPTLPAPVGQSNLQDGCWQLVSGSDAWRTFAETPMSVECPLPDFGRRDNFPGVGRTDPPQSQPKGSRFSRRAHPKGDDGAY